MGRREYTDTEVRDQGAALCRQRLGRDQRRPGARADGAIALRALKDHENPNPEALRVALAPMTNDFVALLKDSSLVSVITVVELTKQTQIFAANIGSWVVPGVLCAAIYLAMSLPLARLARRIEKRMTTVGVSGFAEYVDFLEVHPDEFPHLFNTILINVTGFFRDAASWEFLADEVIAALEAAADAAEADQ